MLLDILHAHTQASDQESVLRPSAVPDEAPGAVRSAFAAAAGAALVADVAVVRMARVGPGEGQVVVSMAAARLVDAVELIAHDAAFALLLQRRPVPAAVHDLAVEAHLGALASLGLPTRGRRWAQAPHASWPADGMLLPGAVDRFSRSAFSTEVAMMA